MIGFLFHSSYSASRTSSRINRLNRSGGTSIIETVIALPIFLSLLLGTIEVCRYFYISLMLNYAAHHAADYAAKLSLEIDTRAEKCSSDSSPCTTYGNMIQGVVNRSANKVLKNFLGGNSVAGSLVPFRHFVASDYPEAQTSSGSSVMSEKTLNFAVLRPGEVVRGTEGTLYQHPYRGAYDSRTKTGGWPDPGKGEDWDSLFQKMPIVVHVEADFQPLIKVLGPIRIKATQLAYRRITAQGITDPTGAGPQKSAVTPDEQPNPSGDDSPVPGTPTSTPTPYQCPDSPCGSFKCACRWALGQAEKDCLNCRWIWDRDPVTACKCGD